MLRITPDEVITLQPNQVLVFPSNYAGRHGKGVAIRAWQEFGAVWGKGLGPNGQTYAIAVRNREMGPVSMDMIGWQISRLKRHAAQNMDKEFLVVPLGLNSDFHPTDQVAKFFFNCPQNVSLPKSYWEWFK